MNLTMRCACLLAGLIAGVWLAAPGFADDGNGAVCFGDVDFPCFPIHAPQNAFIVSNYSRPGSVIVFPLFIRGGVSGACGAGNVLVDGVCLPRTEIEVGATCPTRFTTGPDQGGIPCPDHEQVRVRFSWVCPGIQDFAHNFICKTTGFDVHLTVNGKVVFTANGFRLPDTNQIRVPAAPCDKGYLIGWVIDAAGQPIKYDGLIGEAVIRNSGTAAAAYRAIAIQATGETTPGNPIDLVKDPLDLRPPGLPFGGASISAPSPNPYRLVTGQVTGDVTFDRPAPAADSGFGVRSSLILLTLDVRSNAPNFPTFVPLHFWNGFEELLSTFVEFVCWGEFQLSADIDVNLTQAFMGTRKGIVQSDEAQKVPIRGMFDIDGPVTLLGLVQTSEGPKSSPAARTYFVEFYNNGIRFPQTIFFP